MEPRAAGAGADARISGGAATANLLEQAAFWQQQGQPERALTTLDRLLVVEPNNIEALASAVEVASVSNQPEAAQRYLNRLRRLAPNDPRLARGDELLRLMNDNSEVLSAARRLSGSGRAEEGLARYRQLFRNGAVPLALAPEYYQVLAGSSEAGYREAVQQLGRLVAASPSEASLALTYGQILTYREETRSEGVDRLQQLFNRRGSREPARLAWRQALLWLGDEPETAARIRAYLAVNPSDPELEAKLRSSQVSISPGASARIFGWDAIEARRYGDAERQFNEALSVDPNDTEAVIGLAVLRRSQNRMAEAGQLLARANALSPDRAEEFTRALGDLTPWATGGAGGRGGGGGGFQGPSVLAWRALERGDIDRADSLARRGLSARGQERIDSELILGQIAILRRDFVAAEMRFRNALTLRPRQRDALNGLYLALIGQERIAEAEAFQREMGLPPNRDALAARAFTLRDRAALSNNPEQSLALLRQAMALAPGNPWIMIDAIRKLRSLGQDQEARELQARLEQDTSADGSTAAALAALDEERFGAVVALLERVPVRVRNADTNRLLTASRREFEIRQIELQVREGRPGAADALLAGAGRRDPSFTVGPATVRAFGRLNDPLRAGMAARAALAANPNTSAADRIALASALLDANRLEDATALATPLLADRNLPAETRRELAAVMEGGAVQQADALALRRAPEQGYQVLAPALAAAPNSVPLNMALVRLYVATNRTAEARQLVDAVLERDPRNLAARLAKVDLALAENRPREADALITETAFLYPGEIQVTLAEARVARARSDFVRSLRLVESAGARRLEHLRASGQLAEASLTQQALNPTRGGPGPPQLHDPLTAQIAQELIRARDEAATWLQTGAYIGYRSGDAGLSRLTNITAPTEVSTPMRGGVGGRVVVGLDAVSLNTGNMSSNSQVGRLFAQNALTTPDNYRQPRESIEGLALRAAYLRPNMRADIGTTPLGFARTNVVGGAEVVPRINEQLRMRLTMERRAVTDSLLSYAGQRDSAVTSRWGGVIRTGGRFQLEWAPSDRFGTYAGAGYNTYRGDNVLANNRVDAGIGAYYAVMRQQNQQLTMGVDLRYFGFDKNLSGFTFGQGGYFSPQQNIVASLQAEYIARWGDWSLRTVGAVGYQNYRTSSSPLFPTNSALQSQLVASTNGDPGISTTNPATRSSGITGSIFGNLEYAVTPNIRLGVAGRWERVGDYEDTVGLFYLRWRLDRPREDLLPLYAGAAAPTLNVNDPMQSSFGAGRPEWVGLPSGASRPTW
ncbi:cellulose biosynthesis protein BcsC [Sediminicoccus sp. KRV36]|uniref:cellulose biosynthesis protein BcsC n=1 Tax=Sediminicoccus sp. KRV36 TaxID=3133721 RepID=UPI00200F0A6A|nr:cellulose biosynthesis protein BcsC [Sediminicoccus rosea]UPY36972.1 BCSC C-terminal domain-containing protein [Sediminicoccus rosea]